MLRSTLAQRLAASIRPLLPDGWELIVTGRSTGSVGDPMHIIGRNPDLLLRGRLDWDEPITLYDVGGSDSEDPLVQEAWTVLNDVQDFLCHETREPWPNESPGAVPDRMAEMIDGRLELWFEVDGVELVRLEAIELI